MTKEQLEIQLIAAVVAAACALLGVFLVLRRMSLMSDAISHVVLLGIVLGFFATRDLASPWLVVGAAATGVATVSLVELLNRTRLVREDAAIGLVFPVLFSLGVILVSRYAGSTHLDIDAVLLGELALAPFRRLEIGGLDYGPSSLAVVVVILVLNLLFVVVFYKELKLATFDPSLAAALYLAPGLLHYGLMTLVSVTAVGAFDAVGSVLVVALMIAPPATAQLLTERLATMLWLSVVIGVLSAISGFWVAEYLDASIAGSMATMTGALFGLAFVFAPGSGLVAGARRRWRQRWEFAQRLLVMHLQNHKDTAEEAAESRTDQLHEHLHWDPRFTARVIERAERADVVRRAAERLVLTDHGCRLAQQELQRSFGSESVQP